MISLSEYRLVARKGEEEDIPKYGLEIDFRYYTLDSFIRMYGKEAVSEFLKSHGLGVRSIK